MIRIARNSITKIIAGLTVSACLPFASSVHATTFDLPTPNDALIGNIGYASVAPGETPASIGQRYNVGVNGVVDANPGITDSTVFAGNSTVKLATEFLLPPVPRRGIVVNLPEMRIYYYPAGSNRVMTFPVGIGKIGKTIPLTNTAIARKVVNPVWIPPADIRQYDREVLGIDPPKVMPPGPDNPLGPYAIYLKLPTYLIHSTIFPESIGRRASFGCIRMHEDDIKQFFPMVKAGIPVVIIDMPNKVAWNGTDLYLEAHPPLEERNTDPSAALNALVDTIESRLPKDQFTLVNWQLVAYLAEQPDGVPHEIGVILK